MFYFDKICNKKVMKSSLLNDLNHFFTTRESIIKTKEPDMLKIADSNRRDFCKYFGVDAITSPKQTHSANIMVFDKNVSEYPDTDGLIIDTEGAIALNFADCTPLIFFDGETAAISHAGWRGTAANIAQKTVIKMINEFSSNIRNIKCAIGPAISECCFNIKQDVLDKLLSTIENKENTFKIVDNEIYANLKEINRRQLIEIGINPENIDICPYCTVCQNDTFFSYRKENGTTNRHSAIVDLYKK